jgi:hypothetical protein
MERKPVPDAVAPFARSRGGLTPIERVLTNLFRQKPYSDSYRKVLLRRTIKRGGGSLVSACQALLFVYK